MASVASCEAGGQAACGEGRRSPRDECCAAALDSAAGHSAAHYLRVVVRHLAEQVVRDVRVGDVVVEDVKESIVAVDGR